jgi:seryl-tRNA synthetase
MTTPKDTNAHDAQLLTPEEAAEALRLSPFTLALWRRQSGRKVKGPRFVRLSGTVVRYRRADLITYVLDKLPGRSREQIAV